MKTYSRLLLTFLLLILVVPQVGCRDSWGRLGSFDTQLYRGDSTDILVVTNNKTFDLREVDLTFTFYREDGERLEVKRFWSVWEQGEAKKINVPLHPYQKVELQGTALRDRKLWDIDDWHTWKYK